MVASESQYAYRSLLVSSWKHVEASTAPTEFSTASMQASEGLCGSGSGFHESGGSFHGNLRTSEVLP